MMFGRVVDSTEHSHDDPNMYGLDHSEHQKNHSGQRNTDNERKTPHQRNYTESLSLVSVHHSPSLPVLC